LWGILFIWQGLPIWVHRLWNLALLTLPGLTFAALLTRRLRPARYAESYGAGGRRVQSADGLAPALDAAFREGGVQLVVVPVDYSENVRVLVDELAKNVG
jgi:thiamine pyrophosphate-dependent acetolactate synthase large subunit-like protein